MTKSEWLGSFVLGSLLLQCNGDDGQLMWTCEFGGSHLSTWQIVKKAMWDRVRDAKIVSMHPNMLLQTTMALESPRAVHECPLGLLASRLFLVDMIPTLSSRHDEEDTLTHWMEDLLLEVLDTPWQNIVLSGWPVFGLLARLANQSSTIFRTKENVSDSMWRQVVFPPVLSDADLAYMQRNVGHLFRSDGKSAADLIDILLLPGSAAFWSRLSSHSEDLIFQRALLLGPSQHVDAEEVALYFLRHLHAEFAGSSGSLDMFLSKVWAEFAGQASQMKCWDVGAAPWPDETSRKDRDVWEICSSLGLATEAFEPSQAGFERLQAATAATPGVVKSHQLALSSVTGVNRRFNRGGQVTGSLGNNACNSA